MDKIPEATKTCRLGRAIAKPNIRTNTLEMLGFILQPNLHNKDLSINQQRKLAYDFVSIDIPSPISPPFFPNSTKIYAAQS
jgi:hypothetical protein